MVSVVVFAVTQDDCQPHLHPWISMDVHAVVSWLSFFPFLARSVFGPLLSLEDAKGAVTLVYINQARSNKSISLYQGARLAMHDSSTAAHDVGVAAPPPPRRHCTHMGCARRFGGRSGCPGIRGDFGEASRVEGDWTTYGARLGQVFHIYNNIKTTQYIGKHGILKF